MESKICSSCKEQKELNSYYKDKTKKDGYRHACKKCELKRSKKHREKNIEKIKKYREENKEHRSAYMKEWRKNNSEKIKQDKLNYNEENKEKINQYSKKYREENKEKILVKSKFYKQKNKEKIKATEQKYMETERGKNVRHIHRNKRRADENCIRFSLHQRSEIIIRDNWTCQCCGIKVHDRSTGDWNTHDKAHIDHIIPVAKGGNYEPDNLQTLCRTCNLKKGKKLEHIS